MYDFEYTLPGGEGVRNKLCFIMWYVYTVLSASRSAGSSGDFDDSGAR